MIPLSYSLPLHDPFFLTPSISLSLSLSLSLQLSSVFLPPSYFLASLPSSPLLFSFTPSYHSFPLPLLFPFHLLSSGLSLPPPLFPSCPPSTQASRSRFQSPPNSSLSLLFPFISFFSTLPSLLLSTYLSSSTLKTPGGSRSRTIRVIWYSVWPGETGRSGEGWDGDEMRLRRELTR